MLRKVMEVFVIKEFNSDDATKTERKLFRKEALMLKSLTACENVVKFHAFSRETCAILLEFCCFSFEPLHIEKESVFNLKELLSACDRLTDYVGFEHHSHVLGLVLQHRTGDLSAQQDFSALDQLRSGLLNTVM